MVLCRRPLQTEIYTFRWAFLGSFRDRCRKSWRRGNAILWQWNARILWFGLKRELFSLGFFIRYSMSGNEKSCRDDGCVFIMVQIFIIEVWVSILKLTLIGFNSTYAHSIQSSQVFMLLNSAYAFLIQSAHSIQLDIGAYFNIGTNIYEFSLTLFRINQHLSFIPSIYTIIIYT